MKFTVMKDTGLVELVEEDIYFIGTDGKSYVQMSRISSSYVLAVEAKPGSLTPAPAIVCLRSTK